MQQLVGGLKAVLPILSEQLVVDIVGDGKIASLKDVFVEQGFSVYEQLYRMSRLGALEYKVSDVPNVCLAEEADACVVQDIAPIPTLTPCLNSCLVTRKYWTSYPERVCSYIRKRKVYGFIIFELNGQTLYLRYWFVLPEYRDLKIGSRLFNEFMRAGHATKRQLFWVIASNENAIKLTVITALK